MRLIFTLTALILLTLPASAQMVEAKAVAQQANCKPTKVESLRQRTGEINETLFQVTCQGGQKGAEVKIKVNCRGKMCEVLK